jgi:hypothetical protein
VFFIVFLATCFGDTIWPSSGSLRGYVLLYYIALHTYYIYIYTTTRHTIRDLLFCALCLSMCDYWSGWDSLQFFWPDFYFFYYEGLFSPVVLISPVSVSPSGCISLFTIDTWDSRFAGVFSCRWVLISLFLLCVGTFLEKCRSLVPLGLDFPLELVLCWWWCSLIVAGHVTHVIYPVFTLLHYHRGTSHMSCVRTVALSWTLWCRVSPAAHFSTATCQQ